MDSIVLLDKSEIEEWAMPHIQKIMNEVKESNGVIKEVKKTDFFIEVRSKISNLIRYDKISKDSMATYSIPIDLYSLLKNSQTFIP